MSIQPLIDVEILKERLITKEGQHLSAIRGSLSKCSMRLLEFSKAVQDCSLLQEQEGQPSQSQSQSQQQLNSQRTMDSLKTIANDLIREIKLHDLEMKKIALGAQAMEAEISHYDAMSEKTKSSIVITRQDIARLKKELDTETKVRKNRQEYEELAKMTSERAPSRISKRKLLEENEEIEAIRLEQEKINKKLAMKGKQFHLLMQTIEDLKRDVNEDTTSQPTIM
jgi:chromosome segregation ATPase